jgi:hypothetical protein
MMNYDNSQEHVAIKRNEMLARAKQQQIFLESQRGRRVVMSRFYHGVLAQFGRWLIVSGNRLQRRYGQISDLSNSVQKPMSPKRQVYWR